MSKIIQILTVGNATIYGLDDNGTVWTLVDQGTSVFWTPKIASPRDKS